jgi:hypothetical protein
MLRFSSFPPSQRKLLVVAFVALVFLFLLLILGAMSMKAPMPKRSIPAVPKGGETAPAEGYDAFVRFSGTKRGTWTNATFATSGSISLDLIVERNGTASATIDIGGKVFGLVDPEPKRFVGSYDANALTFSGTDELFGPLSATIVPTGEFSVTAPDVSAPGIDRLEVNGRFTVRDVSAHYIIFFTSGSRAEGSFLLE